MKRPEDQLDQDLEALRQERSPQAPADAEGAELLALARAVRRLRPADSVAVPPAPPLGAVLHGRGRRRRRWLALGAAVAAAAAVFVLVLTLTVRPIDVIAAAEEKLAALTSYHTTVQRKDGFVDPKTGEKLSSEERTEIWYDQGKYRIQMGDDLILFDGDTEWNVYATQRRVVKKPGMPKGRMQFSTVDDLVKWFKEYPHVVEGEEVFAGRPAFRVAVQLSSDVTQYVWLDKKTFLPVGGRSVSTQGSESTWTEQLEINVPIDPAVFTYQPPEGFSVEVMGPRLR